MPIFNVTVTGGRGRKFKKLKFRGEAPNPAEAVKATAEKLYEHRTTIPTTLLFHVSLSGCEEITL